LVNKDKPTSIKPGASGKGQIQTSGKNLVPAWVGYAQDKGSQYGHLMLGGSSAEKIFRECPTAAKRSGGLRSPYPIGGPISTGAAEQDLHGALWNQNSGWRLDGSAKVNSDPLDTKGIFQRSHLTSRLIKCPRERGDFWNAAMGQGRGAKMSENAKRAPEAAAAFLRWPRLIKASPKEAIQILY